MDKYPTFFEDAKIIEKGLPRAFPWNFKRRVIFYKASIRHLFWMQNESPFSWFFLRCNVNFGNVGRMIEYVLSKNKN